MSSIDLDNRWLADLENALQEECCATDIYCICKGKPLPESLRSEVWQICLDVRDKGKISAAMKSKSAEVTGKLMDYIVNPNNSPVQERHVSSNDRIGKRYRDVAPVFSIDDDHDSMATSEKLDDDDRHELVQVQTYLKMPGVIQHFPCQEVKLNGFMFRSHLIVTNTELIVLREVAGAKGVAEMIVKRPLSAIVKITARKRHPELITFKYGVPDGENLKISDMDRFLIPNADKATKVISDQILKQLKLKE
ncbi:TBC1 domain family member 23 isoform X2 [Cylas formicarius]|uniref:TBC1 domain family member 23 isoform X2 n=1 Tax=Cylas formicarius TaxID=197179 RepID=UPI0029583E19|nr:TBC1 domain family member 23 isoform X2 [Cylas formicarius]